VKYKIKIKSLRKILKKDFSGKIEDSDHIYDIVKDIEENNLGTDKNIIRTNNESILVSTTKL